MKVNKAVLKLNTKPHNRFGVASFILAFIAYALSIGSLYIIAFNTRNEQNVLIAGVLEMLGALVTLAGLGLGIIGEEPDDTEKIFAHIGLILHVLGLFYHGVIIYQGFLK
jgi:hypothetical protein